MSPAVSVVVAARNRPNLLRRALLSVKEQSFRDFETIVIDDGSSSEVHDQYREIWKDLDERFVLHLASPPNGPGSDPGRGRNCGVGLAKSDLIAFLDHDDFWIRPDHLEVAVTALQASQAGYYFTHVRFEPEMKDLMWAVSPSLLSNGTRVSASSSVVEVPLAAFLAVMRHSHIHPSHSVVRRAVWDRAGRFIEGLKTADDVNFMLRVADLRPGILYRPEASAAIRMPEGRSFSLSSSQLSQSLAEHQALLDLRCRCVTPAVRRCARARESWVMRQIAAQLSATGSREAWRMALGAVVTFPTAGAVWALVDTALRVRRARTD